MVHRILRNPGSERVDLADYGSRSEELEHPKVSSLSSRQLHIPLHGPVYADIDLRHLARFEFKALPEPPYTSATGHPQPPVTMSVFPPATDDLTRNKPFFTTTLKPLSYLPRSYSFPFNSTWASYFGFSSHLVQPPLPSGATPEECGTNDWVKAKPELKSKTTRLVWWDMRQPQSEEGVESNERAGATENDALLVADEATKSRQADRKTWWPSLGRWRIGLWLDDAVLQLGEAEHLNI